MSPRWSGPSHHVCARSPEPGGSSPRTWLRFDTCTPSIYNTVYLSLIIYCVYIYIHV